MKKLLIICLVGLLSCDPPRIDPTTLNYVILEANVLPYQKFNLGDTLRIRIDIPDSLEYTYYENGEPKQKKVFVKSVQEMLGGVMLFRFDTIKGGVYNGNDSLYWKYQIKDNFQKRPFYSETKIIPRFKGVYFGELGYTSAVKVKINNDFEAQLSLIFDESVNINAEMYCKYVLINQPTYPVSQCLNEVTNSQRFYCFRVE